MTVFQNVYLFADTIENNIKFGRPDTTHEQVVVAARKACCDDFIEALPDGYDTVIGEGGASLAPMPPVIAAGGIGARDAITTGRLNTVACLITTRLKSMSQRCKIWHEASRTRVGVHPPTIPTALIHYSE